MSKCQLLLKAFREQELKTRLILHKSLEKSAQSVRLKALVCTSTCYKISKRNVRV